jgi:hypothetical protein
MDLLSLSSLLSFSLKVGVEKGGHSTSLVARWLIKSSEFMERHMI